MLDKLLLIGEGFFFLVTSGILFYVIGGLGIFMLGMKYMSEGVQTIAGPSLREMISRVTNNRFLAVGTGTTFTLLVQSSSIATVIMVGLVNAGLMQLHQAVGFIMGANIGTTITGWILVLKVGKYGLPVLGIAALVFVFTKNDRLRFIAMAVMGLGMVFFGLQLMKEGVEPLRQMKEFEVWIQGLRVDNFFGILLCVAMGCFLTFIVQSSSAALGILIAAAATGLVPFPVAAAFILGENIGTTTTVLLASLGANRNAKRAAYAHFLFNIIGATWAILAFPLLIRGVSWGIEAYHGVNPMTMTFDSLPSDQYDKIITMSIASLHTSFNVLNTLFFLPFVPQFSRFLERLVPDRSMREVPKLKHLESGGVDSPMIGIEQSRREIILMGQYAVEMMDFMEDCYFERNFDLQLEDRMLRREEILDNMEQEVIAFLTGVLQSTVPLRVVEEGTSQLRLAHEFESLTDCLANVVRNFRRIRTAELAFDAQQLEEISSVHRQVRAYLNQAVQALAEGKPVLVDKAKEDSKAISKLIKQLREESVQRIVDTDLSPEISMAYTSILTDYRRARANILNANQAMSGGKRAKK
jgi:phosphate:Na+ symporter